MDDALITLVLVDAGVCAIIGVVRSEPRGHRRAGLWLGFLFGPLGLIILLLLGRTPSAAARYQVAVERARSAYERRDGGH